MGDRKPNTLVVYPSGLPLNLVVFDPAGILVFCSWLRNPGGIGVSKSFKNMLPACFIVEAVWLHVLLLEIVFVPFSLWHLPTINADGIKIWAGAIVQWLALILAIYHLR